MSITKEDILGMAYKEEQLDFWGGRDPRIVTPQEMVTEYHEKARLPKDVDLSKEKDYSLIDLRSDLVSEEYWELYDELYAFDGDVQQAKALKELADLVYVAYGMAVTWGWNLDEAVRRVHENNMERMTQDDGTIKYRSDGKVIKNPNTKKVNLEDLV